MPIRRSIFWVTLQFVLLLLIEISSLAVLARLLTPKEMGQFAIAAAAIRFFQFIGNFGMSPVIVRAGSMERADRERVVMITLVASGAVGLLALGLAQAAPDGLFDSETRNLLRIMAPVIVPTCLGTIMTALLTREFRFQALLTMRICAALTFPAVAIPLALAGSGAASLAFGQALSTLLYSLVALLFTRGAFLVRPRLKGARSLFGFAANLFCVNALHETAEAALPNLIGHSLGLANLGLFSRARDLVMRANQSLTDTVAPALTPHVFSAQRDGSDLKQGFLLGAANLSAICLPAAGLLAMTSPWLVQILLGPQWASAAPLLGILAIGLAATPILALANIFALAQHKERLLIYRSAGYLVGMALVGGFAGTAGLSVTTGAIVVLQFLFTLSTIGVVSAALRLPFGSIVPAFQPSLVVAALTLAPTFALGRLAITPDWSAIACLAFHAAVAGLAWCVSVFVVGHPLRAEILHLFTAVKTRRWVT
jgi:O-antigen/teichoic acid export membrane protein